MEEQDVNIYLPENRKCIQTENFRSFTTFLNQNSETKLVSISKITDNTLSPQKQNIVISEGDFCIVFLPLVGAIEISSGTKKMLLNSSEICYYFVEENDQILIENPYDNELINYVEIWVKIDNKLKGSRILKNFDLGFNKNSLVEISSLIGEIFIGKFEGRQEGYLNNVDNAFVFVVSGVFEVNNCLLESRTGLLLKNIKKIEFEGLGFENIILIVKQD
jgi:quercetin 2,3-dioxygenase